jgi:hypothetical protein
VARLKAHRATQAAERLHAGEQWTDSDLVFTTEFGGPVDPRNLLRTIEIASAKAGVKDGGVHTLRHSAAVAWLEAGVHIKAVADLLGHAAPEVLAAASTDLSGIGEAIRKATASAAPSTMGIVAAAADEVSAAIASVFGAHGSAYQALGAQTAVFQEQFVQALTAGAGSYASAEAASVFPLQAAE